MIMLATYDEDSNFWIKSRWLLLLAIFSVMLIFTGSNNRMNNATADSTSVQSVPMLNTGKGASNTANAVQNFGGNLQSSIHNVSGKTSGYVKHGVDMDSTGKGSDEDQIVGQLFGNSKQGLISYDKNASVDQLWGAENRLGSLILKVMLRGAHYIVVGMFIVGLVCLVWGVAFNSRSRFFGLGILVFDIVAMVGLYKLPWIFSIIEGVSNYVTGK